MYNFMNKQYVNDGFFKEVYFAKIFKIVFIYIQEFMKPNQSTPYY